MLRNYLKIAFRNIYRQRIYYLIQITGFAIALSCVILILSWVQYEKSYDKFHIKGDRIYRVLMSINPQSENTFNLAIVPPPLAEAIQEDFPEIELATRFEFCPKVVFECGEEINYENNGAFADPEFLDLFSFQLLEGNVETALSDPQNIILTRSLAEKYFDQERPLNEVVIIEGTPFTITGIMEDIPSNSHLMFDFLLPVQVKTVFGADLNDWGNVNIFSYILLNENVNFKQVDEKIQNWKTPRRNDRFYLQQLHDIHSESGIQADEVIVSDIKYVNIFIILAIVILLIACINFVNLQSAQILKRTKEVGLRKVNGATKMELIEQLMIESSLVLLISYLISFILAEIFLPGFKQLFNYKISLSFYDPPFLTVLAVLFLFIVLLTSVIPAFRFASFNPTGLIQNLTSKGKKRSLSRTILVVVQFSFSVFFIIGTIVIYQQFRFMKKNSLNNQTVEIIYLPFKGDIGSKYEAFKANLLTYPIIENVTAKNSIPTQVANKTGELEWPGKNRDQDFIIEATGVDPDYFETLGIEVVQGRNFSGTIPSGSRMPVILNETAIQNTGISNPLGVHVSLWGYPGEIVGVAKDVQFKSLRNKIEGQIFYIIPDFTDQEISDFGVILIKVKDDIPAAIAFINDQWNIINPGTPFEYHFLNEAVDSLYWEEMRLSKLMNFASILSIVICSLGLFGLAIYNSNTRIKEIGIRKINGASIFSIVTMLNSDYIRWIGISFLLAFPLAWFILNMWLQNFAYQINISWWVFLLAGILTLTIAFLTVNWQIFKVARKNPVDILRYE